MRQSEVLIRFSKLTESQKERIRREVDDFIAMNEELTGQKPTRCPKCRSEYKLISHGRQISNQKPRFTCAKCGHTSVYDSGTIFSNLKISKDEFIEICMDTLNLVPIKETAARLDRSIPTVHMNRHKFLAVLEEILDAETALLSGTVEIDETYELESTKGKTPPNRKARRRGEPSKYRGISHEQVCIVTTTDRNGHEIFKAVGFGKPTTKSITDTFEKHISKKSIIYSDGIFVYDQLSRNTESKLIQLVGHETYNSVEHLNTVNNIHKMIQDTFEYYRGIATKYMNRYMSLFVMKRRFQDMDSNEMVDLLIRRLRSFPCHMTRNSLKTSHLFAV